VTAERSLLARLEGGCQVPLGALAQLQGDALHLNAAVCALDGSRVLRARGTATATAGASLTAQDAAGLGERVARELLDAGAAALIARERAALKVPEP
jgi:hydroxymethylbilane synthase